ncbi:MAG: hypothetical protein AAFN42_22620 [Cyanobacteria bacterium J06554_1]
MDTHAKNSILEILFPVESYHTRTTKNNMQPPHPENENIYSVKPKSNDINFEFLDQLGGAASLITLLLGNDLGRFVSIIFLIGLFLRKYGIKKIISHTKNSNLPYKLAFQLNKKISQNIPIENIKTAFKSVDLSIVIVIVLIAILAIAGDTTYPEDSIPYFFYAVYKQCRTILIDIANLIIGKTVSSDSYARSFAISLTALFLLTIYQILEKRGRANLIEKSEIYSKLLDGYIESTIRKEWDFFTDFIKVYDEKVGNQISSVSSDILFYSVKTGRKGNAVIQVSSVEAYKTILVNYDSIKKTLDLYINFLLKRYSDMDKLSFSRISLDNYTFISSITIRATSSLDEEFRWE